MAMGMAVDTAGELGFPFWDPIRRKFSPDSPFFASENVERELLAKQALLVESESVDSPVALDLTEDEINHVHKYVETESRRISCPIAGCPERLKSLDHFEDHYKARHTAACSYECNVEGCGLMFKNYKARLRHLVDKHKFPTTLEFFKKTQLSKKRREKLQRQRVKHEEEKEDSSDAMEVEDKTSVDGLVSALSTLTTSDTTPSNVSFGRRHGRGLTFVPRSVHREKRTESSSEPEPKTEFWSYCSS